MADQHRNGPINIPIVSKDDDTPLEAQGGAGDDDDVIEIDGDNVDLDAELAAAEAAMADAERDVERRTEASAAADSTEADEAPEPAPADEAPAASAEAKGAEISREAVFELMQELRQKSEQVARLTEEKNDLYDRLLRKQAEFENFRKRNEREMQEIYGRARSDVITDLLAVFDNFELALRHADSASAESFREGVQLIYKQLMDSMTRLGLEAIDAEDQPFDPELHEAVATETREDVPDHTVVFVLQRGFKLGDRLLRPARVKVAVQP